MYKQLWIGLIGIKAIQDSFILNKNETAYTNLILLASDAKDFQKKANAYFQKYNIEVLEVEDIDLLEERQKQYHVDKSLIALSKLVFEDEVPRFGTLHLYNDTNE